MALSRHLSRPAVRCMATATTSASTLTKPVGDISSVFPSLRPDSKPEPLPPRFRDLKLSLFNRNAQALEDSWQRLIPRLKEEVERIQELGTNVRISKNLYFHACSDCCGADYSGCQLF